MKRLPVLLLSCLLVPAAWGQVPGSDAPFLVERTLWVKPGRMSQFMTLFERVDRPRLDALRKDGRVVWYRIAQPLLDKRNDEWDLRITIAWKDAATAAAKLDARISIGRIDTERALLEELVVDQQEIWVRETLDSAPAE